MSLLRWLRAAQVFDTPNERSSHAIPTPRGGGWAILLVTLPVWLWLEPSSWPVLLGAFGLALVSWRDDRGDVGAGIRFGAQVAAVTLAFLVAPGCEPSVSGAAAVARPRHHRARLVVADQPDQLHGRNRRADRRIGGGTGRDIGPGAGTDRPSRRARWKQPLLGGAALGFTLWNWRPAKLFLGDVGSVADGISARLVAADPGRPRLSHREPAVSVLSRLGLDLHPDQARGARRNAVACAPRTSLSTRNPSRLEPRTRRRRRDRGAARASACAVSGRSSCRSRRCLSRPCWRAGVACVDGDAMKRGGVRIVGEKEPRRHDGRTPEAFFLRARSAQYSMQPGAQAG